MKSFYLNQKICVIDREVIPYTFLPYFSSLEDSRVERQKKHQLQDIFFITLCAVIRGADNWVMIEGFRKSKEEWFTEQLNLEHGIPSHDTFGDVFTVYFISSLDDSNPERLGDVVRAHWAVGNNVHWVLDIAFDEDSNRTRKGYSASSLAVIRHIVLNLIKNEVASKVGIKTKRAKAGWHH